MAEFVALSRSLIGETEESHENNRQCTVPDQRIKVRVIVPSDSLAVSSGGTQNLPQYYTGCYRSNLPTLAECSLC